MNIIVPSSGEVRFTQYMREAFYDKLKEVVYTARKEKIKIVKTLFLTKLIANRADLNDVIFSDRIAFEEV